MGIKTPRNAVNVRGAGTGVWAACAAISIPYSDLRTRTPLRAAQRLLGAFMRHLFSSFGSSVVALLRWPGWRELVSRAALPMLALAASYGVYSFALLFVPQWVAITQAAAFELRHVALQR